MAELTIKQLNHLSDKPYFSLKDPVSAITHLIGVIASVIACPLLMTVASLNNHSPIEMLSLAVFSLSMIVLYSASTIYHSLVLPNKYQTILKKFDHISILYLIAGTYTPICVTVLNSKEGYILLALVWAFAIVGTIIKLVWINSPKYVSSILYISMGWLAILSIKTIFTTFSHIAFFWLLLGGILYTIGGVLYSFNIKINEDWGNHEVFHLFVLAGSLCHYIMMFMLVL